ncbi:MAG: Ig-like domain-containing protein [Candidatus Bathyarchaeota archaeon]|nr:Ig-like domain-containing protein [Candidatus Bathyarchaeota archaeon]
MKLSTKLVCICIICTVLAVSSAAALAAPTASLSWYKNNGYGMGNDIGGQWTLTAEVSSDVERVEFYLDDELQQNITASPYKWSFNTADFSLGEHTVKAVAYNAQGQTFVAQADRNFVEFSLGSIWVIIAVVIVAVAVSLVALLMWVNKKEAKKGKN